MNSAQKINLYKDYLIRSGVSPATIERKLSSVRSYFAFIEHKQSLSVISKKSEKLIPVSTPIFTNENFIEKLASLGIEAEAIKVALPRQKSKFSQNLSNSYSQLITKVKKARYTIPYSLKYSQPKWLISYQKKSISRFVNYGVLLIVCVSLGIGGYEQFIKRTQKEGQVLGTTPVKPPTILSFQGRLTDAGGTPITSTKTFTFNLYNIGTGGTALWTESKSISPDSDGIFNTYIGDSAPIDQTIFRDNTNVYLGVAISPDEEMTSRQQVATVGYAFNSQYLQGYDVGSTGAQINQIPVVNSDGNIVIAASSPAIQSSTGSFKIIGAEVYITTTGGNINFDPNALGGGGSGNINLTSSIVNGNVINATSSALRSGALIYGDIGNTASNIKLIQLQVGNTASDAFFVDVGGSGFFSGNLGIGVTRPSYKLEVNGGGKFSGGVNVGAGLSVSNGVTFSGLSTGTGTTALFTDVNGNLSTRVLGTNAFNSNTYDNYVSWSLLTNGLGTTAILSGNSVNLVNGVGISMSQNGSTITINNTGTGTTYSANNGITLTSGFFGLGGTLSSLTKIDQNSNNFSFWGTGNVGIGTTNQTQKLDVNGGVNIGTSLTLGTMLYVGTGASVSGDVSINGGDLSSNQTTFRLLDNTVTTLNIGGAATAIELGAATGITSINNGASVDLSLSVNGGNITTNDASFNLLNGTATTINFGGAATLMELGAATGVLSINTGASVDGTLYTAANLRVGTSANITTNLNVGGTFRVNNNSFVLDNGGNVTTGIWKGTAVGVSYGGTGANIGMNTGAVIYASSNTAMAANAVGTSNQILASSGSGAPVWLNQSAITGTTYSANNGITKTASNFFQWGGQLSQLTTIDMNSNNIGFWNTGNIGIGNTNPIHKLDLTGDLNVSTSASFGTNIYVGGTASITGLGATTLTGAITGNGQNITDLGAIAGTSANMSGAIAAGNYSFIVDSTGSVTTGTWKATAIGVSYGGTGLTTTPTSGQLLIGNNNGYTLGTIAVGNSLTVTNGSGTINISHADTSSQTSSDNTNGVVIQDIGLDGLGHLTSLATVDLDSRYLQTANVNWVLKGDSGTPETVNIGNTAFIVGGSGVTSTVTATDTLTLDVGAGAGITVGADTVGVDQTYAFNWTGAQSWSQPGIFYGNLSVIGNVGIGTTATQKLDVNGSVNVGGSLRTGTMLYVGTGASVTGDASINGGDLTSNQTTFRLLDNTVTTLYVGGAATSIELGAATGVLSINTGASVDGTLYTAANLRVGTSANITTNLNVGGTFRVNNNSFVLDNGGNVTTGTWKATAIGVSYGGTGLTTTPTSGQLLIGNNNGYTLGTISVGNSLSITNGAGTISISHADTSSQAASDNANGVVIQDIGLDGLGHLTSLATVDLDSRYLQTANVNWVLKGDSGTPETVGIGNTAFIVGGSGMASVVTATDTLTLNVGAGNGITVGADSVAVDQTYAFNWTGAQSWSQPGIFYGNLSVIGNVGIGTTATQKLDVNGSVNVGGSITTGTTINVGTNLYTVGSVNVGTSAQIGTNLLVGSSANINGALTTTGAITAPTTTNTINGLVIDATGSVTTGTWNGTAVGVSYGGTGANIAMNTGAVIYASSNTAMSATAVGTSNQILASSGSGAPVWLNQSSITGTTYSATNGITLTSGFFKWGGQLSELTKIDQNSNNIGFWNTGNIGIGTTNPAAAFQIGQGIGGTAGLVVTSDGKVGIGTTSPANRGLNIRLVDDGAVAYAIYNTLNTNNNNIYGMYNDETVDTTSETGYGVYNVINATVGATGIGYGTYNNLDAGGTMAGTYNDINSSAAGNSLYGAYNDLTVAGTSSKGYGSYTIITTTAANAQTGYGDYVELKTGAGDSGYGGYVVDSLGTSTGGTQYGYYVNLDDADVTNYSIYVDPGSGMSYFGSNVGIGTTNVYGIFQVGQGIGGTPQMLIKENGNVGIGTTSPSALFSVGTTSGFQINSSGNIIAGSWNGNIISTQYGGTGINGATAPNGALLIGNGSGYSLATLTAGTGIGITNAAGSITINAIGTSTGTTYSANNGITLTGSNFFQWGGQLSQLTTIDQNSQNIGFWGTGNIGIGNTNPTQKLDITGSVYVGGSLTTLTMLYVGTGASVTGDVSVNGGDISSNQTTFNLLNNTVTTLNIGGAATMMELGAATGVLSINTGASVDGTLYAVANLRVGTSANITTNLNVGGTFRVNNNSFVLDNGGNITTGIWKGTAVGTSYGGTGLTTTATSGQLLIGNNNGYTLGTISVGNSLTVTNGAGTISISHADTSSQANSDNSNGVVIQDIGLDGLGHLTSLATVDLDSRYLQTANVNWVLKGDSGTPETVNIGNTAFIVGGSGMSSVVSATDTLTLNVGAGNGISVAADGVAVDQTYAFNWTGAQSWSQPGIFYGNLSVIGNVGIGTTATQKLDVNGSVNVGGSITTGTMLYVGTGASIAGDASINGGDLTSNQTTFRLLDNTVTTLYVGGAATLVELGAATGVLSINTGASVDGTLYTAANLRVGTSANITNSLNVGGTFRVNNSSFVLDNGGNITTGIWKGTAVGTSYGGTGLTTTATSGQLLIGNNNGYTLATLTAGTGIGITNAAGSITINAIGTSIGTTYSANNGITLTGSNFFQWGGQLSQLTTIDMNSNNIGFWNTGSFGIGTTNPSEKLEVSENIKMGGYLYKVANASTTLIRATRSDASQEALLRYSGWGDFDVNKSLGIGYNLDNGVGYGVGNLLVSGNVGIGTTSPTQKLQVTDGYLLFQVNEADPGHIPGLSNGVKMGQDHHAYGMDYFSFAAQDDNTGISVAATGKGTPSSYGYMFGFASSDTADNRGLMLIDDMAAQQTKILSHKNGTATAYPLVLGAADTTWNNVPASFVISLETPANTLFLKGDGNVGIGTSIPAYKLDVNGNTNVGGSFSVNASSFIIDSAGNVTAGAWKGTAVAAQYGGTGINGATAANGTILIGNGSGYSLTTLTAGTGIGITNAAGSITINAIGTSTGTTYSANNGITLTGSNFFQLGGQLSQLTKIDQNSNNFGFFGTGNVGIGYTNPAQKLDVNGSVNVGGSLRTGTMLYVGTGASVTGDVSVNGGDISSNQTTFRLLDNTVTTLNIGGAATALELGAATGVLSINTGASVDGTLYTAANLRVGTSANVTTNLNVGGTFRVNNSSFVLDNGGNITTGIWKGTAVGTSYGGTGLTTTATSGQLLIGNNNGYTLATLTAGTGIGITNAAGSITINAIGGPGAGTTYSANNGITLTGSNFFQWGGQLSQLTTIDMNSNNIGFWNTGNFGIGTTSPLTKLSIEVPWTAGTKTPIISAQAGAFTLSSISNVNEDIVTSDTGLAFNTMLDGALTEKVRISSGGNVGIGLTSPAAKLDVYDSIDGSGISPVAQFAKYTNAINEGPALNFISNWYSTTPTWAVAQIAGINTNGGAGSKGALTLSVSNNGGTLLESMRINDLGYVGIGTTSPTQVLDVNGSVNVGGSITTGTTITVGTNLYTVGSVNVGTSAQIGTNLLVGSSANINGALRTTGAITAPTTTNTINGLVIDATGNITTGTWKGTAVGTSYGGTGLTTTATSGQLLIGNNNGYTLATITAGTGIGITNGVGSITINAIGGPGAGTTYSANNGITLTGSNFFQLGGTLSQLTKIDQSSNNFSFWGTGNVGIGTTNQTQKLDVNGGVNIGTSLTLGTMLYVGTGASVSGDVSVNGGDLSSNQTTFRLLDNTVTTLNIGGAATVLELGAATGVLSINTGASVDGTLYTAANLRVGTSANVTTNLNVGGTFRVNNSSFILDNGGNITTGIWKGTAVGVSYGGTGLTTTPTSGQLLIGNNNGYTLATLTAGTGIGITNAAGSITINALGSSGTGTTYSANNGITKTGSNFFQWGGQLSQLTTIDMNSNNIGFWNTGMVGIGTTNPDAALNIAYDSSDPSEGRVQQLIIEGKTDATRHLYVGINTRASNPYGAIEFVDDGDQWGPLVLQQNGGNVGIGTTSPTQVLDVNGSVNVGGSLRTGTMLYVGTGVSVGTDVSINGGDLTTDDTTFNLLNGTATTINFGGAATLMELGAATGLVSINNGLSVDGNMYLVGALNIGSSVKIGTNLLVGSSANITTDLRVNGDVLVGTAGSGDLRLMNNQILNSAGNVMLSFTGTSNLATLFGAGNVGIGVGLGTSGLFQVGVGGTPSFFIQNTGTDSGNVGVGTTTPVVDANPSRFFTVSGDTSKYGEISVGRIQALTNASVGGYNFFNSSITAAEKRIAAIWGNTDSNINSGALTFNTWDTGTVGERMRIAHDGNVGIGTTSPSWLTHISSTAGGNLLGVTGTLAGDSVGMYLGNYGDSNIATTVDITALQSNRYGGAITFGRENASAWTTVGNADGYISFSPVINGVNTERVRINSNGNVGIGTTSPLYKLDLEGTLGVSGTAYFGDSVGIGTANPGAALEVNGNIMTTNNRSLPNIVLDSTSTGDNWTAQGAYISLGESGALGTASMHMTYTGDGYGYTGAGTVTSGIPAGGYWRYTYNTQTISTPSNVGIGTTNPTQLLDVNGSVNVGGSASLGTNLYFGGMGGDTNLYRSQANVLKTDDNFAVGLGVSVSGTLNVGSSANIINNLLIASGNIGINTIPTQKLDVNGSVNVGGSLTLGTNAYIGTALRVGNSANIVNNLLIASGNIGIGTIPTQKLDVNGSVNVGGSLTLGTNAYITTALRVGNSANIINNLLIASGNIGINTIPTQKLDVNGSVRIGGSMTINNKIYVNTGSSTGNGGLVVMNGNLDFIGGGSGFSINWMERGGALATQSISRNAGTNVLSVNGGWTIAGALTKGSGTFLIDDPIDPQNKVLRHSFVESPEMMNIYKGRAVTQNGIATITLPDWFNALNGNNQSTFEYSFTPIKSFCKIAVKDEIRTNQFTVASDRDCAFSWIVYAVRHDRFALDHPVLPEESKSTAWELIGRAAGPCLWDAACNEPNANVGASTTESPLTGNLDFNSSNNNYGPEIAALTTGLAELNLTSTGDLVLDTSNAVYTGIPAADELRAQSSLFKVTKSANGQLVTRVLSGADGIFARIKSGLIDTTNLIAENIAVQRINTGEKIVSPVIETNELKSQRIGTDFISPLSSKNITLYLSPLGDSAPESGFGKLIVNGNAEFSGNVGIGATLQAQDIVSENLTTKDATITGELVVESARIKKLRAESIVGLDAYFASMSAQNISTQNISGLEATPSADLSDLSILRELLASASAWPTVDPSNDVKIQTNVSILGVTTLAQTVVAGTLTQDGTLVIENGNSINVIGGTLYLQDKATGGIDLLAGKVTIDQFGNAIFNGDLTVKGNLYAETIKATTKDITFDLSTPNSTESAFGKLIAMGADGKEAFSVDASGSATMAALQIQRPTETPAPNFDGTVSATSSAGVTEIASGSTEVTIKSPFISEKSLVYLTPIGSTQNQVLYIKSVDAIEKSFTIAVDQVATNSLKFNWWIIN